MTAPRTGRRAFLAGTLAIPATATAALPAATSGDSIRDAAQALADAMQARHGGRHWTAHVDHDVGFILIQPGKERAQKGGAS